MKIMLSMHAKNLPAFWRLKLQAKSWLLSIFDKKVHLAILPELFHPSRAILTILRMPKANSISYLGFPCADNSLEKFFIVAWKS